MTCAPSGGGTNWDDPCARAKALRDTYYSRLEGGPQQRIRFREGDNEQDVQSGFSALNLTELRREMQAAEDECRASQGLPPLVRRRALVAGMRRRP